jgi:hypothetical protein
MVLFFIEISTRRVQLGGIAKCPNGLWMGQIARAITDCEDGVMKNNRYLIHDRDPLFTADFTNILRQSGIQPVKLPPRSPNLNAFAERSVRSIKEDCLDRLIFFGEDHLRRAVRANLAHYHAERNHQGLQNALIFPAIDTCYVRLQLLALLSWPNRLDLNIHSRSHDGPKEIPAACSALFADRQKLGLPASAMPEAHAAFRRIP